MLFPLDVSTAKLARNGRCATVLLRDSENGIATVDSSHGGMPRMSIAVTVCLGDPLGGERPLNAAKSTVLTQTRYGTAHPEWVENALW
jgi:hypothetical protein